MRLEMRQRRDRTSPAVREARARRILDRLSALPEFRSAGTVLLYASFRSEVPTPRIAAHLTSLGKTCVLPRVVGDDLRLHAVPGDCFLQLKPGSFAVPEPDPEIHPPVPPRDLDLCLVPGLAFDLRGNRIGYGKGFFDRLLRSVPPETPRWGLAFDFQVLRLIPSTPHDAPLTGIITERANYRRQEFVLKTGSEEETRGLASRIGRTLAEDFPGGPAKGSTVFALVGPLGSGKTRFAQGLAHGLGCRESVLSPTFVLARHYQGPLAMDHLDLYRLGRAPANDDLRYFEEILNAPGVTVVEWAEHCLDILPLEALEVYLETLGPEERVIRIVVHRDEEASRLATVLQEPEKSG